MARSTGGIAWLQRLWRRAGETEGKAPGTAGLLPVETAVAALEVQVCDGIAHAADLPASAAAARRLELPGQRVRNAFGRPVAEESAASARDRVAVATGMALAGLRATAFLNGDELESAGEALRGCAERRVPLVLHAALDGAGHAGCSAVAESGCFQVLASSGQEALDWTLVARWVAERSLVPGLVLTDVAAIENLRLPQAETIASYLGRPDEPIPAPTEAQRLLFGVERARLMPWFDLERPVATGGLRGNAEADRALAGARQYFWEPVANLAAQAMEELARVTGRTLARVQPHQLDDAEIALVVRGTGVGVARAVADHLRQHRGWKVGVLGVPWLRPFPAAEIARALAGRRALAVVEAVGSAPPGGATLFREVEAALTAECARVSATCGGAGPEPAALAGLCELLRRPDPPARVDLERVALPETTGFPRRDALLQSLANTDPSLREVALPETEPPGADPPEGRSAGAIGLESELPPDALSLLAEAAAAACGSFVRGAETRPEPGVWEARVRAAARDFHDPGLRAAVSFLLVGANARSQLGNPLAALAHGGAALLATADPPEQLWAALPAAWRRTARERELRLFTAPPAFEAGLELLGALLRGEEGTLLEAGKMHEVRWRELPALKAPDAGLPGLVRRIPRVRPAHDSLPRFWGEIVQPRQGGADDRVPDPLSASGAVPAGASALQPAAEATALPLLDPAACTGCGRCWSACPDSAIGATALGSEALLTAASRVAGTKGTVADALRRSHKHLADRLASSIAKGDAESGHLDADTCREAWGWLRGRLNLAEDELPAYEEAFEATLAVIERLEPVVSDPLFREPEAENKGDGALLVLAFDPHACLGCGLCVAACPDEALRIEERTPARVIDLEGRWRMWEQLPDTTGETIARAAKHPDVGPLAGVLLSRHCGQAQIGGGDGEPGSGERLAGRLVVALVERSAQRNAADLVKRLGEGREQLEQKLREGLSESLSQADLDTLQEALAGVTRGRGELAELAERLDALGSRATFDRGALLHTGRLASELDRRRQRLAEGVDGLGRARFGVVVARGAAAAWAARYPGNPYYAPLTLAPTAEGAELARGIARGLVAGHLATLRDLRRAALVVEAPPDLAAKMEAVVDLAWEDLDAEERAGCPPLLLLGDDRALLEQGFEALTRLLDSDLPIKVILLDGRGQLAPGPEPALVAMAHRRAFVLAASPAHPAHLGLGLADALAWPGPALVHLVAPSPRRHGFPADDTLERARLAVEGRAHVLLRYDPGAEGVFGLRASLDGNPAPEDAWGEVDFATWAAGEDRFAEHFDPVEDGDGLPVGEWLALPEGERAGRVPVALIGERRLAVGARVARAAAERSSVWSALRELSGGISPFTEKIRAELTEELEAERSAELEAQKAEYEALLAEARAGVDREAVERLTTRLMALSGFGSQRANEGDAS